MQKPIVCSRSRRSPVLLSLLLLVACSGDGGTTPPPPPPPPPPPVPTAISVSPATATLSSFGETAKLTAEVRDQNGNVMTGVTVTWESSAVGVATVDGTGLVTSVSNGSATVSARAGSASGAASVTVEQRVANITLGPEMLELSAVGDTARLTATATDANDNAVAELVVTWASGDTTIATVDEEGLVTGVAIGSTEITATSGSATASVSVVVAQDPAEISLTPGTLAFASVGDTTRLVATVLDAQENVIPHAIVTWSSSDTDIVTVDSTGLVSSVANGSATVSATVGEVTASITVTVTQEPDSISIRPATAIIPKVGGTRQLKATVLDANGNPVTDAAISWSSSNESVATVNPAGLVTATAFGSAQITATSASLSATARVDVRAINEREVLEILYHATGGENWRSSYNWLTDEPLDAWAGVWLSGEGRVEVLHLEGNNLVGELPAELGLLTELTYLSFTANQLSGSIPPEIGNLTKVGTLYLGNNNLSGPLPPEMGNMTRLADIQLARNQLSGIVPGTLGKLANLKDLWLFENQFTGYGAGFGDMPNLQVLFAGDNLLTEFPIEVTRIETLADLRLERQQMAGPIPPEFFNLRNLENLWLFENRLTGQIPAEFGELPKLISLIISSNQFGGTIPPGLANSATLREIELGSTSLTGEIPKEFGRFQSLVSLAMDTNDLTGRVPAELGNISSLTGLTISYNPRLTGLLPRTLLKLEAFNDLTYWDTQICAPKDAVFQAWLTPVANGYEDRCTTEQIERLTLEEVYDLTGGDDWSNSSGWKSSQSLDNWHGITMTGGRITGITLPGNGLRGPIPSTIGNLVELRSIDLSDNDMEGSLSEITIQLPTLEELRLNDNARLEGRLPYAMTEMKDLHTLTFANTGLCASPSQSFQSWYNALTSASGAICGNPPETLLQLPVVYLNQSIQRQRGDVPTIAGRDALLRVFPVADQEAYYEPDVVATFFRNGQEVYSTNIERTGDELLTEVDESSVGNSYNAIIPGEHLLPGTQMVVEVDSEGMTLKAGSQTRYPSSGRKRLDIVAVPPMELTVVPVVEAQNPDTSIYEWTNNISDDAEEVGLFKYAFPFGEFTARARETYATSLNLVTGQGQADLVGELIALRAAEGATGYWYGAASSHNGYVRGLAYFGTWTSIGKAWDTELAHEVGHTFDLEHAPCGGAGFPDPNFPHEDGQLGGWGYDFGDGSQVHNDHLVNPDYRRDIMGYCYHLGWLSDYYFEKVIEYRERVEGDRSQSMRSRDEVLVLWGGVFEGEIRIRPLFSMTAAPIYPDQGGPYRLEGLRHDGGVEFSLSFTPDIDKFGNKNFFFTVPIEADWQGVLDRVVLTGPEGQVSAGGPDDERSITVVTDPATGRIRAILNDFEGPLPDILGDPARLQVQTTRGITQAVRLR